MGLSLTLNPPASPLRTPLAPAAVLLQMKLPASLASGALQYLCLGPGTNFVEFISKSAGAERLRKFCRNLRPGLIFNNIFQICGVELGGGLG